MKTKPFNYAAALKRASRGYKVWEYPLRKNGTLDRSKRGRYVIRPDKFEFAIDWKPRLKVFKYKRRSEVTFDPNTCEAFSYGHWKFVWRGRGDRVVFNSYSYSHTTNTHQSMVRSLLRELRIKPYLECDLGARGTLDYCYERLFQYQVEQNRRNAKSRAPQIRAELENIRKGRACGVRLERSIKEIKAEVIRREKSRLGAMAERAAERKRLRDRIRAIAKADPATLSPNDLLMETNAEVRRMLFSRIGGARVLKELNAEVLDKVDDYEVVNLDLGDGRKRPFLKMVNPSTGETHVEGVPPWVTTVLQALSFRNGTDQRPKTLT